MLAVSTLLPEEGEGGEEGRKKASDRAGKKGVTRTGPPPGQQHTRATPVGLVQRPRRASNGCFFKNLLTLITR